MNMQQDVVAPPASYDDPNFIGPVLVKFFLNEASKGAVPKNLPNTPRKSDRFYDAKHSGAAIRIGKRELGETGRVRKGRVDTGEQAFDPKSMPLVCAKLPKLDGTEGEKGWQLTSAHTFKKDDGNKVQHVVVLTFELLAAPIKLEAETIAGIEALAASAWQLCNVWRNPAPATAPITVNFVGRQVGVKPKHVLLMPPNEIGVEPIDKAPEVAAT